MRDRHAMTGKGPVGEGTMRGQCLKSRTFRKVLHDLSVKKLLNRGN